MTLSDADRAVDELQWCLDHGARVVTLRHGAAFTADGMRSPAHPMFDRFWDWRRSRVSSSRRTTARTVPMPTCPRC